MWNVNIMLKIDFNQENMEKCLCAECPVQAKSSCVKDQIKIMDEIGHSVDIDSGYILDPEVIPKVYCSTGKTECEDLYYHEECQCTKCPVWKEYDLEVRESPAYFCKNGKAIDCCKITDDIGDREAKLRELKRTYYTPI
jgi:hypothetical protein